MREIPQQQAQSPLYVSAPVDAGGPDFINAVALVDSGLSAAELLAQMQCIETAHGRGRPYRHAPRTLDLDLLLYGNLCLNTPALTLPHPRLHERAFVLLPLLDVWPDAVIPGLGSAADWLPHVGEQRIQRLAE